MLGTVLCSERRQACRKKGSSSVRSRTKPRVGSNLFPEPLRAASSPHGTGMCKPVGEASGGGKEGCGDRSENGKHEYSQRLPLGSCKHSSAGPCAALNVPEPSRGPQYPAIQEGSIPGSQHTRVPPTCPISSPGCKGGWQCHPVRTDLPGAQPEPPAERIVPRRSAIQALPCAALSFSRPSASGWGWDTGWGRAVGMDTPQLHSPGTRLCDANADLQGSSCRSP